MLSARNVEYRYPNRPPEAPAAVTDATLEVGAGDTVALVGASGSGKTSLLYCLAGVTQATGGCITFEGRLLSQLSASERARTRLTRCGFVFQFAELVPELSLLDNIALPLRLTGTSGRAARARASELAERLGIGSVSGRRPASVSGGQSQRAAVARALVHRPAVIFADEPTGSLDATSGRATLDELLGLAQDAGTALVVVTHDESVARRLDRRITMRDGRTCEPSA